MLKSKKFIIAAGGLLIEAAFLVTGNKAAAEIWESFFWKIYLTFAGINQLQKWIEKK